MLYSLTCAIVSLAHSMEGVHNEGDIRDLVGVKGHRQRRHHVDTSGAMNYKYLVKQKK